MTIKYNVSGAKARNGKEIMPMAFSDRAEAERFAKYHEGLSVPQNLRKHPGNITTVGGSNGEYNAKDLEAAEKFFARPVESLALQHQEVGRLTRIQDIVTITTRAQPLDKELTDKVVARVLTYDPSKAISLADMQARYAQPPEQPATVGNADLESAYEMGFRLGMSAHYDSVRPDAAIETQDYVDQRRSNLKELVSYDRSK